MDVAVAELELEILAEEQRVGLPVGTPATDAAIAGRRRQICFIGLLVFFTLVMATLRADVFGDPSGDVLIDPDYLRAATITFAGVFVAYGVDKERHLRRLDRLGRAERDMRLVVASRLLRDLAVAEATAALHTSLVLDEVVERIIEGARRLTEGAAVELRLGGTGRPLRTAGRNGDTFQRGVVNVPIVHRESLLGVLSVVPRAGQRLDEDLLDALHEFATRAAATLANARLYENALAAAADTVVL